jgi:phage terminase Nu1 subunit (DNA packaging protein)
MVEISSVEIAELCRWHERCASACDQSDDFNGAAWHRDRLAQWRRERVASTPSGEGKQT